MKRSIISLLLWVAAWRYGNVARPCRHLLVALVFLSILNLQLSTVFAQGTAFMYQGRLNDGGNPAGGIYDLRFTIYDSTNIPGTVIAGPLTNSATAVSNGLFTVNLDFGPGVFTGADRWLDIGVRTNGSLNAFTGLAPRQHLTPVPYAIFANTASNLSGSLPATQLSGTLPASAFAGYTNTVVLTNNGNIFGGTFNGTFTGNGGGVFNVNVANLTGVLADNQLPSNTAFVNSNQTFIGSNNFTGGNLFSGANVFTGTNFFTGPNNFTNRGNSFIGSFFGNGLVGWIPTNGTAVQADIDHGYLLTSTQLTTVTLPPSPTVVDIVRISGAGSGGWNVAQNAGQSIIGSFSSYAVSLWTQSAAPIGNWKSLAVSSDGSRLLAGIYGGQLYLSTDFGSTWVVTNSLTANWQSVACSADGTKEIGATYGGYIYTNSGKGWAASIGTASWWAVAASADGNKLVAVIGGNADSGPIYTSTNFGGTWVQRGGPGNAPTSAHWWTVTSSADGTRLAASIYNGGLYTSSDSGANWTLQNGAPANTLGLSLASSGDGTKLAAAIYGGGIHISSDSGATWASLAGAPSTNWEAIACSADGRKLVAAVYAGYTYVSGNQGLTWLQQTNSAVHNWFDLTSSSDGSRLAGVVNGGGIYTSQASAQTTTTTGTNGYLSGSQGSAVELQYIGNGQFMPVSSAGIIWAF